MTLRLFLLISFAAFLSSCTKDKENPPATGDVKGTITPAYAVTKLTLMPVEDTQLDTLHITPDSDGNFHFTTVKPGTYFLVFFTTSRFLNHIPLKITVTAGVTNDLGSIAITPLQPLGNSSISGIVSPANAVVYALITGPSTFSVIPDPNTGAFTFPYLPAGNYTLTFIARPTHVAPPEKKIELANGQQLDLGTLPFAVNELVSKLSCNLTGTPISFDTYINNTENKKIVASYSSGELSITGSWITGNNINAGGQRTRRLTINLDDVTGPGTYTCKGTAKSEITYNDRYAITIGPNLIYSSSTEDGKGTVIITAFDPVAKTLKGTFTGILKAKTYQGTVVSQEVSAGIFDIKY
ncbi:MAG: hypothetical protein DI535_09220 [Citrobacter freundii]|nr:MAG: hypothetical protein DI535_09220 [Citrobacter freundii]